VILQTDAANCTTRFELVKATEATLACDRAREALASRGIPYAIVSTPGNADATLLVGQNAVVLAGSLGSAEFKDTLGRALAVAGYPEAADPARIDFWHALGLLLVLVVAATALYGPQAACLVELFPAHIRYTALSLPYHIGTGWVGGFLPAAAFALTLSSGDVLFGLWYPVVFASLAALVMLLFVPETCQRSIHA
jgi:hypothetical protein